MKEQEIFFYVVSTFTGSVDLSFHLRHHYVQSHINKKNPTSILSR